MSVIFVGRNANMFPLRSSSKENTKSTDIFTKWLPIFISISHPRNLPRQLQVKMQFVLLDFARRTQSKIAAVSNLCIVTTTPYTLSSMQELCL